MAMMIIEELRRLQEIARDEERQAASAFEGMLNRESIDIARLQTLDRELRRLHHLAEEVTLTYARAVSEEEEKEAPSEGVA